jgi:hypothetical protein
VPLPSPWTQSLRLSWRPELSFYEKRVEILKSFEEQGVLRAFRFEADSVDAQLFDSRDRLTVKQDGLDLQLLDRDADPDRAMQALEVALGAVAPDMPRHISASFQYINPLDLTFEQSVERAYGTLLGILNEPDSQRFGDWAVLIDLAFEGFPSLGQIEFGIIKDKEAPRRLARVAGKMGNASGRSEASRWQEAEFPPVALFADGRAEGQLNEQQREEGIVAVVAKFWECSRREVGTLVERLHNILLAEDVRRVETR